MDRKKETILSIRITSAVLALLVAACAGGQAGPSGGSKGEGRAGLVGALGDDPKTLIEVGEGMERSGNLGGAINLYNRALEADPGNWMAGLAIGRVIFRGGDVGAARTYLASLQQRFPHEAQVTEAYAEICARSGDFETAARVLEPLIRAVPLRPSVALMTGKLLEVKGDPASARQMFALAEADPVFKHEAMAALAWSFAEGRNIDTARAMLTALIADEEGKPLAQTMSLLIRARQGENPKMEGAISAEQWRLVETLPRLDPSAAAAAVFFGWLPAADSTR